MRPGTRKVFWATGCVVLLLLSMTKGWGSLLTLPITFGLLPIFVVLSGVTGRVIAAHLESRWCRAALRVPQAGAIAALVCIDAFYPAFDDTDVAIIALVFRTDVDGPAVDLATAITKAAFTVGSVAALTWLLALLICRGRRSASTASPAAPKR